MRLGWTGLIYRNTHFSARVLCAMREDIGLNPSAKIRLYRHEKVNSEVRFATKVYPPIDALFQQQQTISVMAEQLTLLALGTT